MNPAFTVYLVDDEPGMLKALTRLLTAEGYPVQPFSSAAAFLAGYVAGGPGCLILDVAMPGMDGLELQERLTRDGVLLPILFLTGNGDIPMSVRAMKAGAADFLAKPVNDDELLRAIRVAATVAEERWNTRATHLMAMHRLEKLTPREREVLEHVLAGKLNKQIASDLGTGEQNIKIHRGRVMEKMGVESLAELVRIAEKLGVKPAAR